MLATKGHLLLYYCLLVCVFNWPGTFAEVTISSHQDSTQDGSDGVHLMTPQSVPLIEFHTTNTSMRLCDSSVTEGSNISNESTQIPACQMTENPTDDSGQSSQGGQGSSSRSSTNGRISKAYYTSIMKIVDPVRFSLHLLAIPVLTLTVISFAREKNITCSNSFVMGLNIFEALATILNAVFYIMKYSLEPTDKIYVTWVLVCNYGIVCSRRVVYMFNLLLCVQRLVAVTYPMKSRLIFTSTWRNWTFLAVICAVWGAHVYLALMYEAKDLGNGMHVMARTIYYREEEFLFDCLGYAAKSVFSYIPLFLSLVVNCTLIVILKRHNMRIKKMRTTKDEESKSKQERQMTLMILVSTMSFTFMSLPSNINQMTSTFLEDYGTGKKDHYLYSAIRGGVNGVQTVGDLTNFASYILLSSTFRKQVLLTLRFRSSSKKHTAFSGITSNTALQSTAQDKMETSVST